MRLTLLETAAVALAGGGVGFVAGVFGVGGGFLVVPVLNVLLGVEMDLAVGAGTAQALGPATAAILARKPTRETLRLPLVLLGGLLCGVVSGAAVLERASAAGSGVVDQVVLVSYLVLLGGLGGFAVWESRRSARGKPLGRGWLRAVRIPPTAVFPDAVHQRLSLPVLAWFAVVVGFLSGLLGISGGLILLPGLIYLFGVPGQDAVRSSLVIVFLVSMQATAVHAWNDNVDLAIVSALLLGGTVGARFGTRVGIRLGGAKLRQRFGWLLIATAAMIGVRLLW